jgi:hypothetical protein
MGEGHPQILATEGKKAYSETIKQCFQIDL